MASWADERPNDHDTPHPEGRRMPCPNCGHDEHVLRCQALLNDAHAWVVEHVLCPCRDVPVPGVHV